MGDLEDVVAKVRRTVDPVLDLVSWDHERVARLQRIDGQERNTSIVPPHEVAGEVAVDDAGEDARHGWKDPTVDAFHIGARVNRPGRWSARCARSENSSIRLRQIPMDSTTGP